MIASACCAASFQLKIASEPSLDFVFVPVPVDPGFQPGSSAAEKSNRKRHLVGMARGPGQDALHFCNVILNRADLDELFFNDLRVTHEPNLA